MIHRRYTDLIPILESIAQMPRKCRETFVIAIDGRAASGKSTLAARLAEILDTDIVHMDDFFLPPSLRTAERLAEPGGNVHYERFAETIISHLKNNESFTYPVFNCSKMQLSITIRGYIARCCSILYAFTSASPKTNRSLPAKSPYVIPPRMKSPFVNAKN